jgi:TRAP transporter TAXI family solute receptor
MITVQNINKYKKILNNIYFKLTLVKKIFILVITVACAFSTGGVQAADRFINVVTGPSTGVYYPLGVALSTIYSKNIPESRLQVQATKASVENLNLLYKKRAEIAFTLGDTLIHAWHGDKDAGFYKKLNSLRVIAALYPNYVHIVSLKENNIHSLNDLKGKSVSVGAPKSGTEINARALLQAVGMNYKDLGRVEYMPFSESVDMMKNKQLDAMIQSSGLGAASIRDLASHNEISIVPVKQETIDKIGLPYQLKNIPENTYNGQNKSVPAATVMNFLVTHKDVPDDLVYDMTKLMFEHLHELRQTHSTAEDINLKSAYIDIGVPYHPAALKFYQEKNITLKESESNSSQNQ